LNQDLRELAVQVDVAELPRPEVWYLMRSDLSTFVPLWILFPMFSIGKVAQSKSMKIPSSDLSLRISQIYVILFDPLFMFS
jgi:hypothetical protein